jgi:hypothetical protein
MLTFTEQAGSVISLMIQLAPGASGVRLSGSTVSEGSQVAPPVLRLVMVYEFLPGDELLITRSGVPVFIESAIAPRLRGAILDGHIDCHGRPQFTAFRDEQVGGVPTPGDPFEW